MHSGRFVRMQAKHAPSYSHACVVRRRLVAFSRAARWHERASPVSNQSEYRRLGARRSHASLCVASSLVHAAGAPACGRSSLSNCMQCRPPPSRRAPAAAAPRPVKRSHCSRRPRSSTWPARCATCCSPASHRPARVAWSGSCSIDSIGNESFCTAPKLASVARGQRHERDHRPGSCREPRVGRQPAAAHPLGRRARECAAIPWASHYHLITISLPSHHIQLPSQGVQLSLGHLLPSH